MPGARLDLIHAVHRTQVKGVGSQSVKRVGRHAQHLAGPNLVGRIPDERRLRLLAVDLENLRAHTLPSLQRSESRKVTYHEPALQGEINNFAPLNLQRTWTQRGHREEGVDKV